MSLAGVLVMVSMFLKSYQRKFKMKNIFTFLRSKGAAVGVASMALATQAHAVLPAWATNAAADLGETVGDWEGVVGPIVLGVTAAIVGIRLFKRFAAKI